MRELNYTSLEACQRLVEAGIVLETDVRWSDSWEKGKWEIVGGEVSPGEIPAPSMAELWRELPGFLDVRGIEYKLIIWKYFDRLCCAYRSYHDALPEPSLSKPNSCDALAELLIWEKEGRVRP